MYADFAINNTGDLVFAKRNSNYKSLNIKFNITKTNVQKISFLTSSSNDLNHGTDNYLKLSFMIENVENKTSSVIYKDDTALSQLIAIQLQTTLGELPYRTTDGSKLNTFRHQNINDKNLRNMEIYLETFLKDYIANPSVIAKPVLNFTNGYKQEVELNIYSNNSLLLQYNAES